MGRIPGILAGVAGIGICIHAGTLDSEAASTRMAVLGGVVGVLGLVMIFVGEGKKRR